MAGKHIASQLKTIRKRDQISTRTSLHPAAGSYPLMMLNAEAHFQPTG
jgi:hypothetical protein